MKPAKFIRKRRTIFEANQHGSIARDEKDKPIVHKTFPTIAEAKRASRKIQVREDGGLGRGSVRVIA